LTVAFITKSGPRSAESLLLAKTIHSLIRQIDCVATNKSRFFAGGFAYSKNA
jgi:hypothetical protein